MSLKEHQTIFLFPQAEEKLDLISTESGAKLRKVAEYLSALGWWPEAVAAWRQVLAIEDQLMVTDWEMLESVRLRELGKLPVGGGREVKCEIGGDRLGEWGGK